MFGKGLAIWLLLLVSYGSAGPRIKRLTPLLSISQPPPSPYPIWKIHRYTGIQLQPVEPPHKEHPIENENPSIDSLPDYPVNEPEEPDEEDSYTEGGFGSILSLVPGGLTGLLSLSAGSGRNEEDIGDEDGRIAEDRIDGLVALKKDILTSILQKKKELLTALKRDAIQLLIRKAKAKKAWVKSLIFGSPYYYNVPYYPKKARILSYLPFVGHWFMSGSQLPEVHIPHVPNLIAVKDPPQLPVIDLHGKYHLPYKSGTYVKVDYPGKYKPEVEYQVPSTSYGVPEGPNSAPQLPYYEKDSPPSYESVVSTAAPEVAAPEVYPYSPESPAAPQYPQTANTEQEFPYPDSYPYSQDSYPYAPSDYYDTAQSQVHSVKERPVYKHLEDTRKESGAENTLQEKIDKDPASDGSIDGDNTQKSTETVVPK